MDVPDSRQQQPHHHSPHPPPPPQNPYGDSVIAALPQTPSSQQQTATPLQLRDGKKKGVVAAESPKKTKFLLKGSNVNVPCGDKETSSQPPTQQQLVVVAKKEAHVPAALNASDLLANGSGALVPIASPRTQQHQQRHQHLTFNNNGKGAVMLASPSKASVVVATPLSAPAAVGGGHAHTTVSGGAGGISSSATMNTIMSHRAAYSPSAPTPFSQQSLSPRAMTLEQRLKKMASERSHTLGGGGDIVASWPLRRTDAAESGRVKGTLAAAAATAASQQQLLVGDEVGSSSSFFSAPSPSLMPPLAIGTGKGALQAPLATEIDAFIRKELRQLMRDERQQIVAQGGSLPPSTTAPQLTATAASSSSASSSNPQNALGTLSKLQVLSVYREAFAALLTRFPEYSDVLGRIKTAYDGAVDALVMNQQRQLSLQIENKTLKETRAEELLESSTQHAALQAQLKNEIDKLQRAAKQHEERANVADRATLIANEAIKERDKEIEDLTERVKTLSNTLREQSSGTGKYVQKVTLLRADNDRLIDLCATLQRGLIVAQQQIMGLPTSNPRSTSPSRAVAAAMTSKGGGERPSLSLSAAQAAAAAIVPPLPINGGGGGSGGSPSTSNVKNHSFPASADPTATESSMKVPSNSTGLIALDDGTTIDLADVKQQLLSLRTVRHAEKIAAGAEGNGNVLGSLYKGRADLLYAEEDDIKERCLTLEAEASILQRRLADAQHEVKAMAQRLEATQQAMEDETLTPRPEWVEVQRQVPEFKLNHLASSKDIVTDLVTFMNDKVRIDLLENERKAIGKTVSQWLGETNMCESDLLHAGKYFVPRGTGPHVPIYLRTAHRVRDRRMRKGDVESLLKRFWGARQLLIAKIEGGKGSGGVDEGDVSDVLVGSGANASSSGAGSKIIGVGVNAFGLLATRRSVQAKPNGKTIGGGGGGGEGSDANGGDANDAESSSNTNNAPSSNTNNAPSTNTNAPSADSQQQQQKLWYNDKGKSNGVTRDATNTFLKPVNTAMTSSKTNNAPAAFADARPAFSHALTAFVEEVIAMHSSTTATSSSLSSSSAAAPSTTTTIPLPPLDEFFLAWLVYETGGTRFAVELAYNMLAVCERYQSDPDCGLFLRILNKEVCERTIYDQMVLLSTLYEAIRRLDTQMHGHVSRIAIHRTLARLFPAKRRHDMHRLRFALIAFCRGSDVVDYKALFREDHDGNQTHFIELLRSQHFEEIAYHAVEVEESLRKIIDPNTGRISVEAARAVLFENDPRLPPLVAEEILCCGSGCTSSELTSKGVLFTVPAESFLKRIRTGVLLKRYSMREENRPRTEGGADDEDDAAADSSLEGSFAMAMAAGGGEEGSATNPYHDGYTPHRQSTTTAGPTNAPQQSTAKYSAIDATGGATASSQRKPSTFSMIRNSFSHPLNGVGTAVSDSNGNGAAADEGTASDRNALSLATSTNSVGGGGGGDAARNPSSQRRHRPRRRGSDYQEQVARTERALAAAAGGQGEGGPPATTVIDFGDDPLATTAEDAAAPLGVSPLPSSHSSSFRGTGEDTKERSQSATLGPI